MSNQQELAKQQLAASQEAAANTGCIKSLLIVGFILGLFAMLICAAFVFQWLVLGGFFGP